MSAVVLGARQHWLPRRSLQHQRHSKMSTTQIGVTTAQKVVISLPTAPRVPTPTSARSPPEVAQAQVWYSCGRETHLSAECLLLLILLRGAKSSASAATARDTRVPTAMRKQTWMETTCSKSCIHLYIYMLHLMPYVSQRSTLTSTSVPSRQLRVKVCQTVLHCERALTPWY